MKLEFLFEDGSLFVVPEAWRDVYRKYFGGTDATQLESRLRFVVAKYVAHQATPSKFDGIGVAAEGDDRYDDPAFYTESWADSEWSSRHGQDTPSMASIAEGVLYFAMRVGLLQKMANEYAVAQGTKPIRVMTVEELLRELPDPDETT